MTSTGLRPTVQIDHSEAANDKLTFNGLGGDNASPSTTTSPALIQTLVDLGGDNSPTLRSGGPRRAPAGAAAGVLTSPPATRHSSANHRPISEKGLP